MLRDRLVQIRELLAADGSVWVHLDDAEMHRCRAVLDEVFGANNFIATVVWKKSDSPRNSARYLSVDQDYIHIYAKDAEVWRPNRLPRTAEINASYKNPDNDPRGPWIQGDPFANKPYSLGLYEVVGPTGNVFGPPPGRYWRISEEKFLELDKDGRVWWRGGGEARPRIKRYLSEVANLVPRTAWDHTEVGSNSNSSSEVRKLFPGVPVFATPKPERLLQRILSIGTGPGDIVLDCYAGSATTAAVAQKMGRRWITSEWSAETVSSFSLPRLQKVVQNEDPGGITTLDVPTGDELPEGVSPNAPKDAARTLDALDKAGLLDDIDDAARAVMITTLRALSRTKKEVLWAGGGGFRVLDVGPSMFEEVDGQIYLADWAVNGALAEAVAAQVGFAYKSDGPFSGTKGKSRLAVVDGLVNDGVVRLLLEALPDGQTVSIYGTAIEPEARDVLRDLRRGSTLRKIPSALLSDYRKSRAYVSALTTRLDEVAGPPAGSSDSTDAKVNA